jgi:DNA-binding NtrC family response regulator
VSKRPRVLFVEDREDVHQLLSQLFRLHDVEFDYDFAVTAGGACSLMNTYCYDGVVVDFKLPDFTGSTLMEKIRDVQPDIPLACMTDYQYAAIKEVLDEFRAEYWPKMEVTSKDSGRELIRRVRALIARKSCPDDVDEKRQRGGLSDTGERRRQSDKPMGFSANLMSSQITPLAGRRPDYFRH